MSATMKGGADLSAFLAALPVNIERNVLRTALKAGADVIADAARSGCRSSEVRESIKTSSGSEKGLVSARIQTKGDGAYMAPWLEYGTDPHFITIDGSVRDGKTVRRINAEVKRGSLVIAGKFVGSTIHHPGARPYPFMRPALDTTEGAAIAAIGNHIAARMTRVGIETPPAAEPDE